MILGYILFGVFIKNHRLPVRTGNRQAAKYVISQFEKRIDYSTTRTARTVAPIMRLLPFNFAKSEAK